MISEGQDPELEEHEHFYVDNLGKWYFKCAGRKEDCLFNTATEEEALAWLNDQKYLNLEPIGLNFTQEWLDGYRARKSRGESMLANGYTKAEVDEFVKGRRETKLVTLDDQLYLAADLVRKHIIQQEMTIEQQESREFTESFEVDVTFFMPISGGWHAMISTNIPDGNYYEVRYSKQFNQAYISTYVKTETTTYDWKG